MCTVEVSSQRRLLSYDDNFSSLKNTKVLRGLLLTVIILFHQTRYFNEDFFCNVGYIAVFMFFMMSGYGLQYSSYKDGYMRTFLAKRFVGLYLQYVFIYWGINLVSIYIYDLSFDEFLVSFASVPFSITAWFIIQLLCFYVVFYVVKLLELNPKREILLCTVLCTLAMFMGSAWSSDYTYIASGLGFPLGMFMYSYKSRITVAMKRYGLPLIIMFSAIVEITPLISFGGSVGCYIFSNVIAMSFSGIVYTYCYLRPCSTLNMLFLILGLLIYATGLRVTGLAVVLSALSCIVLLSRPLAKLGEYSYEMYLVHWAFIVMIANKTDISNPLIIFLSVFILSLAMSVALSYMISGVMKFYNSKVEKLYSCCT